MVALEEAWELSLCLGFPGMLSLSVKLLARQSQASLPLFSAAEVEVEVEVEIEVYIIWAQYWYRRKGHKHWDKPGDRNRMVPLVNVLIESI